MRNLGALLVLALLLPAVSWAGVPQVNEAPALGDAGLIGLGVGLAVSGFALLRRTGK